MNEEEDDGFMEKEEEEEEDLSIATRNGLPDPEISKTTPSL